MPYCLNPGCEQPDNPDQHKYCQGCGSELSKSTRSYLFEDYRIVSLLQRKGFTTIYLAEDHHHQLCILKRIRAIAPQVDLPQIQELFNQDAQRLYLLNHPQIPKLSRYFWQKRWFYLVESLIKGTSLREEFTQQGPFTPKKIKVILRQILPVLQYLEQKNVVHQNIQPENIIRHSFDESLSLVNFGITTSKLVFDSQVIIPSYAPEYAAPEQMRGRVSTASDIYSLGVTCVRLLTGCLDADSLHLVFDDYHNSWTWQEFFQSKNIKLKPEFTCLIDKMIANSLEDRYASATEAINDLNFSSTLFYNKTSSSFPTIKWRDYWKHILLVVGVIVCFVLGWKDITNIKLTIWEATSIIVTGCSILTLIKLVDSQKQAQAKINILTEKNKKLTHKNLRLNFDNQVMANQMRYVQTDLIFKEDFVDNERGWIVGKNPGIKQYINENKYFFAITKYHEKNFLHFSWIKLANLAHDYDIELKTTFVEGEKEGWYGLIIGTDDHNYYLFRINRYGYARVSLYKNSVWEKAPCEMRKINCSDQMILKLKVRDDRHFSYYVSEASSQQQEYCVGSNMLEIQCHKIGFFVSVKRKDKIIAFDYLHINRPVAVKEVFNREKEEYFANQDMDTE